MIILNDFQHNVVHSEAHEGKILKRFALLSKRECSCNGEMALFQPAVINSGVCLCECVLL